MNSSGKIQKNTNSFFRSDKKNVIKLDKEGKENIITIAYKIKFINSARLMTSSLSNLVSNLVERINRIKINAYFAIKIIQTKYEKLKKKFKK